MQRSGIGNENCSYECQFCSKVHGPSRLVSGNWAKYKDVSNENIEMWCKNTSKLTKLKDFCLKSMDKLAKERWMYVNDNSKALRF